MGVRIHRKRFCTLHSMNWIDKLKNNSFHPLFFPKKFFCRSVSLLHPSFHHLQPTWKGQWGRPGHPEQLGGHLAKPMTKGFTERALQITRAHAEQTASSGIRAGRTGSQRGLFLCFILACDILIIKDLQKAQSMKCSERGRHPAWLPAPWGAPTGQVGAAQLHHEATHTCGPLHLRSTCTCGHHTCDPPAPVPPALCRTLGVRIPEVRTECAS